MLPRVTFEQPVYHRVEVQDRDHGHAIGGRLVEGEVFSAHPVRGRRLEQLVDEGVPQFVGEHVEVEAERLRVRLSPGRA